MARAVEARIEAQHGPNCTCTRLEPISFQPVIAGPHCPGEPTRHTAPRVTEFEFHGSVIITWPAPAKAPALGAPLLPWPMTIHDHATGEQMLGVSGLRMAIGGELWNGEVISVDLTELVGDDGKPLRGNHVVPVRDPDDPQRVRTGVFRYYVAEMRIREEPTVEQSYHAHAFPADDSEPPVPAGPCECGMTYERYQQLAADEAAGIRYRNETAAPVDQYGRAVETPFA